MQLSEIQNKLLAVLFAAGEPLEAARMAEALELGLSEVHGLCAGIGDFLDQERIPLEVRRLEDSYQLCTRAEYAPVIRQALELRRNAPLSAAALEVLAIIAYNQPVTRGFVEQVRGVDSSSVVSSLVDKGLVEEAGRMDLPGRPIAYRTTAAFLRCFGLESLEGLPQVDSRESETEEEEDEADGQLSFGDSVEEEGGA